MRNTSIYNQKLRQDEGRGPAPEMLFMVQPVKIIGGKMTRNIIIVLIFSSISVTLTGCETTSDAKHGSVSDSVNVHFKCREETKAYSGGPNEIDMFKSCMEKHGYAPDGKPLNKPETTSTSASQ